ncbi:MAG: hopanoid biosynthesis-associated protein HpnK [Beijerinckiaceae bacterium]|nr:hopanoid biosynthesis-associated protein HpnK [Beijerinckiaceae bacterium]
MTSRECNRLVVTADDFGLSRQVNEAVELAHRDGILTTASLMVGSPAAAEAIDIARRMPSLKVGLHLVMVEARPVLSPDDIPDLVDGKGFFRSDMARFGADIFFRPQVRRQLEAEIEAQFTAFKATGLRLDHVNAHKHFHIHPTIGGIVVRLCAKYRAPWLRVPAEDARLVASIDGGSAGITGLVMRPWTALLKARAHRAGIATPDHVFGLAWSGGVNRKRLLALGPRLPAGFTEIYTHPATDSAYEGAAPGYLYSEELAALIDPAVKAAFGSQK